MASEQKQDTVAFVNVQKSYPPGEQLKIGYTLSQELKRSTRDWVGLFKVQAIPMAFSKRTQGYERRTHTHKLGIIHILVDT